ncbi:LysR family transcriptional regulator [Photobacterium aquimaris]|uniref:HTH-type transcriptional activator AllS n=2 Tax=Photobacterium TaxID=657 RepID=A0A1A6TKR8_9GAMM|nr:MULTISPECIES: DNA-binding transcriptional activator PunR [Photobacterium]OBU14378.1 LysR family transcriptional regulator [Photobacterium aquimaris]OBU19109.1 LysR family transcriptional regulator [Photobacterium aquimaris]PSU29469.1 LysR family transcriptional regulator [Photobacterium aquimaris]PSW01220.1 LysR family transcriptional regulator [Photobacterium aquimaris]SMY15749.1 HTH-type transcriptional activator AllS [Photobacterium aquimaris]
MFSYNDLQVIDVVARRGSFSGAAEELHKVPSAISYTVRLIEERLAVELFVRLHRQVKLTPAGEYFVEESRKIIKQMQLMKYQTQRVANGWSQNVSVALDTVVRQSRVNMLVRDFYEHFPDVELHLTMEVFNGVWDALADGRADIAIGATAAVPVGGSFDYRDMGTLTWKFVIDPQHPLASCDHPLEAHELAQYPAVCLEDTSRTLPKRITWLMDNQRRILVPNWHSAMQCLKAGLGVSVVPSHMAVPLIETGELIEKELAIKPSVSPCCLAWNTETMNPAVTWLLDYLGDSEQLHRQWVR